MANGILRRRKRLPKNVVPYSLFLKRLKAKEFAGKLAVAKERKMTFGKYKGRRLGDVPYDYLSWLANQKWLPEQHPKLSEHVETMYRGILRGVIPKPSLLSSLFPDDHCIDPSERR